jgi:plasmid stabilization system protein ParE
MALFFTPEAESDLVSISEYIAQDSVSVADGYIEKIPNRLLFTGEQARYGREPQSIARGSSADAFREIQHLLCGREHRRDNYLHPTQCTRSSVIAFLRVKPGRVIPMVAVEQADLPAKSNTAC